MNDRQSPLIILASGSPRRRDLLKEVFSDFVVVPPQVVEPTPTTDICRAAHLWVEALAYLKAAEIAQSHPESLIIAADTVCLHSGRIIGKPADISQARHILTHFFAGTSKVVTGLAVLLPCRNTKVVTHAVTELDLRPMTNTELEDYLNSGLWQGKAGAYAYQEGGDKFVKKITGSESNVVGLPLELLREVLAQNNLISPDKTA